MGDALKKLGEAELEIMQVIWSCERPVNSNYILKELQERRKWQLSTLMTSLARLAEKGFVHCDRSTGSNLYTAVISEDSYKSEQELSGEAVQQLHTEHDSHAVQQ